ncbi:MAG: histidine kinase [Oscillospiraceae bacterium]|jgi:signal transduction histidine kinase|nr:histidine kinase [Oscillospiraceae bacterium]
MQTYAIFARLFTGAMLLTAWGLTDSPLSGVVFVLLLTALSAFRYRFKPYKWLGRLEIAVCVGFAAAWLPALLGLWLPLISLLEGKWREWEQELLHRDFEDRAERLKLERERESAALELRNAAHLAEINERSRIAQDIHDHAGHEITGALIALQTAAKLQESGDRRAGELLAQTITRLESASANLRETVHNLKPVKTIGISTLEELCGSFKFCEINFSVSGYIDSVKHFELLTAILKEALTNVSRHSDANLVTVRIDGNEKFIRMIIHDNGRRAAGSAVSPPKTGMGLTGMKDRVRAVNGTLTVSTGSGFKITCVIPKGL